MLPIPTPNAPDAGQATEPGGPESRSEPLDVRMQGDAPAAAQPQAMADAEPASESLSASDSSSAHPSSAAASQAPADCAEQLRQRWPALFAGPTKPLKLRIQVDIQERAPGVFTRQALSAFFRRYTGSTAYLRALASGKHRYDLDGQPAGEVSIDNRKVASDELARRRNVQNARRDLEEQQRRNRATLLHDHERTTLTRANFCALKGIDEAELERVLAIAREERSAMPRPPDRRAEHGRPSHGRPNDAGRPGPGRFDPARRPPAVATAPERGDRPERPAAPGGAARHRDGSRPSRLDSDRNTQSAADRSRSRDAAPGRPRSPAEHPKAATGLAGPSGSELHDAREGSSRQPGTGGDSAPEPERRD